MTPLTPLLHEPAAVIEKCVGRCKQRLFTIGHKDITPLHIGADVAIIVSLSWNVGVLVLLVMAVLFTVIFLFS